MPYEPIFVKPKPCRRKNNVIHKSTLLACGDLQLTWMRTAKVGDVLIREPLCFTDGTFFTGLFMEQEPVRPTIEEPAEFADGYHLAQLFPELPFRYTYKFDESEALLAAEFSELPKAHLELIFPGETIPEPATPILRVITYPNTTDTPDSASTHHVETTSSIFSRPESLLSTSSTLIGNDTSSPTDYKTTRVSSPEVPALASKSKFSYTRLVQKTRGLVKSILRA